MKHGSATAIGGWRILCTVAQVLRPTPVAQTARILTEVERIAHYRDLAVQFRQWAETETNEETRLGLLDMARQYERLVSQRVPTKN